MRLVAATLLLALLAPAALAQSGPCGTPSVSPLTLRPGAQGGAYSFDVVAPVGCAYVVTGDQPWITPASEQVVSTGERATVSVSFAANPDASARSGYIGIDPTDGGAGVSVYVEQLGGCDIRVSRTSFSFPVEGGHGLIDATVAGGDCEVGFASGYDWIVVDTAGGFDVSPNNGYERQGAISVGPVGGSATVYVQVFQTGPMSAPGTDAAQPTGPMEEFLVDQVDAPGAGLLLTVAALALAIGLRRR